ncbi:MAG: trimethylamine methyltransferase family protein [Vicinamibacterales bacterium]|jgi:trimethylamine--corrinoid protein Co-methyltransferase|nr:trimethylamine methyltransferase family protein [Vicinamibacterales bacterium]|tara:strand:+ start:7700 stop:9145 length:1446 start_codon:yes stop_codon:yes gene_type:complete
MQLLEPALVDRIVHESMAVLENTGVLIEDAETFSKVRALGLPGDESSMRIRFPRATLEQALRDAPKAITLHDREGTPHSHLADDRTHFVPASSALRILDRKTDQVRDPLTADFVEYVKVCDGLDHIAYLSTAFIPTDVPKDIADAWRLYLHLTHSKKPIVSGAFTAFGVRPMAKMMECFRSDKQDLIDRPMSIFTCCPNTPLRWSEDSTQNLIDCAEAGIPIEVVPVLLLGMISPCTLVGALVLHTAEVLSGLAIAQTVRPGTPVAFGGAPASFHMRLMTNPMTAVEVLRVYCGYAQIAKHLDLPSQAYLGLGDGKFNDAQAGAESGIGMFLAAMAGFNSVSGPGMLDYVNCFSLEKLVFDDELAGQALHFARPTTIVDDLPAGPLIEELTRDGHLLTSEHTLAHWEDELYIPGIMVDRTNREQWENAGSPTQKDRAAKRIESLLADYEPQPIDREFAQFAQDLLRGASSETDFTFPSIGK